MVALGDGRHDGIPRGWPPVEGTFTAVLMAAEITGIEPDGVALGPAGHVVMAYVTMSITFPLLIQGACKVGS